jgi:hypothetical protein
MTTTPQIGLSKPAAGANSWDVDLNGNADILDGEFHATTGHDHSGATGHGPNLPQSSVTGLVSALAGKQASDADLTTIAGLTATTDNFIQAKSSAWASRTPTQVTADLIAVVGDSGSGGTKGLVPAPGAGDAAAGKFLKASGAWAVPPGSGVAELDDIPDVNAPSPANGDVLTWDSTPGEWVATSPGALTADLDDLSDVNAPTPSDGDVLTWDSTPGEWVAAAPTGGSAGALVALHDETLLADTASFSYSPPGSGYRDLRYSITGATDEAANNSILRLRLNADSGANYDDLVLDWSTSGGTSSQLNGQTGVRAGYLPGTSAPASTPGRTDGELSDYLSTTWHKAITSDTWLKFGTTSGTMFRGWRTQWWRNTAAITAIAIDISSGTGQKFKAGTRFTVWGIKAS